MASFWDRQLKKEQQEMRRKKMFDNSGADSGTFISQTGASVTYGKTKEEVKDTPLPPFLRFTQKVWDNNPEINALSADQLRKLTIAQERAEYELANKYVVAIGTPEQGTKAFEYAVHDARNYIIPWLRFAKSLQLLTNAPSIHDAAVTGHEDYWTFEEFKKFSTEQRAELDMTTSVFLMQRGIPEFAGIG